MEKLKVNMVVDADETLINKMMEAYKTCPAAIKYLKELDVPEEMIEENIVKIYDFVSDINYCRNCPGMNKCQKNNPLLNTKIVYSSGVIDRELTPCKEFLKRLTFEKQFIVKDFPDEWLNNTFKDIDKTNSRQKVLKLYKSFLDQGMNNWVYVTGDKNTGRSFFIATLAIDAAKKNKGPICYINSSKRLKDLYDISKDKERFDRIMTRFSESPILIIDDFGNEFKNDYIRDAILFPILSTRANKKLCTIFTSDFSIDEIQTLYSTSKTGEIRAKQLANLIRSMAKEEINFGSVAVY